MDVAIPRHPPIYSPRKCLPLRRSHLIQQFKPLNPPPPPPGIDLNSVSNHPIKRRLRIAHHRQIRGLKIIEMPDAKVMILAGVIVVIATKCN
jgi:hypothetical protein